MDYLAQSESAFAEQNRLRMQIEAQNAKRKRDYAQYFNRRLGLQAAQEVCEQIREINANAQKGRAA